jgi:Tfp pilus assembly protein PilV
MKRFQGISAFSLVEVTFALGVASFCLLALIALLPVGTKINQSSTQETMATNILSAVIADMRTTPATATTSTQFGVNFSSNSYLFFEQSGVFSTSLTEKSTHRLDIVLNGGSGATLANLTVTWPAAASPGSTPSPNVSGSPRSHETELCGKQFMASLCSKCWWP